MGVLGILGMVRCLMLSDASEEGRLMEMNLLDDDGWLERTWPPERPGYLWRRKRVAGEHLGAGLIELPPGERLMVRWGPGKDEGRWFFVGEEADYWAGETAE